MTRGIFAAHLLLWLSLSVAVHAVAQKSQSVSVRSTELAADITSSLNHKEYVGKCSQVTLSRPPLVDQGRISCTVEGKSVGITVVALGSARDAKSRLTSMMSEGRGNISVLRVREIPADEVYLWKEYEKGRSAIYFRRGSIVVKVIGDSEEVGRVARDVGLVVGAHLLSGSSM
jgi:hypothetical protein